MNKYDELRQAGRDAIAEDDHVCITGELLLQLLDENAALRAALQEAVDSFYQNTHPGFPAKQSGHVRVETINRWKQALGDAS